MILLDFSPPQFPVFTSKKPLQQRARYLKKCLNMDSKLHFQAHYSLAQTWVQIVLKKSCRYLIQAQDTILTLAAFRRLRRDPVLQPNELTFISQAWCLSETWREMCSGAGWEVGYERHESTAKFPSLRHWVWMQLGTDTPENFIVCQNRLGSSLKEQW